VKRKAMVIYHAGNFNLRRVGVFGCVTEGLNGDLTEEVLSGVVKTKVLK
jgi:hypothetical protein